ncbi:MAG: TetR/AcrR family transcriptional regulator [Deltaproteobacteria bacterium]|nr:TetR/AcrR family transcriptional regulator [Deltaproteobacteria bacterium]
MAKSTHKESRELEREAKRGAILAAAQRVAVERGFHALSMSAVAAEAGVSKAALYLYFDSRAALVAAILLRNATHMTPVLRDALGQAATGLTAIRALLNAHFAFYEAHPQHFAFMLAGLLHRRHVATDEQAFSEFRAKLGENVGLVTQAIERGKLDGTIRTDLDTRVLAKHLWASFLGVFLMHYDCEEHCHRSPLPVDSRVLVATHIELELRAIASLDASTTLAESP